ncbi:MAG: hypothetical protein E7321_00035 [Clostridiales bacterium]|nr:hypothetical protein [Clostridiales bacterium]
MAENYVARNWTESNSKSTSNTQHQTTTRKILDKELMQTILSGLSPQMTEDEVRSFAESLLRPQLHAGLEAAQQQYDAAELALNQEKEDIAVQLAQAIAQQQAAYKQNAAQVETAALARGMGRSSYTLDKLSQQGDMLAETIRQLTDEGARQQGQVQQQITQAAKQNAQTQGRLNTDYAAQLAAKTQELLQNQKDRYNSNYMSAVSAALGSQSSGSQSTESGSESLSLSGDIENGENFTTGQKKTSSGTKKTTVLVGQGI